MTCDATGSCLLQDLAYENKVKVPLRQVSGERFKIDDPNPFIQVDRNKCILCRRCVRACSSVNGVNAVGIFSRGFDSHIGFGADGLMTESKCEFCGSCVAVCPTGALYPKLSIGKGRSWNVDRIHTICSYCGVGCQIILEVKDNEIVKVESAWNSPVNHGWTCVKGRFGYDYVHHPDRLKQPRVRKYLLESRPRETDRGEWVEVDWDVALDITANKLREIGNAYGPDSIGVLTSAKCTNEENYLMNKFARQVIGTNNIDHCARL
jgi:predicted molibdopterin-dependent oxidoreductase YjgC